MHRVPEARDLRLSTFNWRRVIFSHLFFIIVLIHQDSSLTMLPFEIPANALYKLFFITSVTVLNGFIKLTLLTLRTCSSSIPDRTLIFIYQFLESFEIDTDIDLLNNGLPIQTTIDISYLIEHLYGILIEVKNIPRVRNTETIRTLVYRAAIAFTQQDILPVPNSRILKRILFRVRYIEDLTDNYEPRQMNFNNGQ